MILSDQRKRNFIRLVSYRNDSRKNFKQKRSFYDTQCNQRSISMQFSENIDESLREELYRVKTSTTRSIANVGSFCSLQQKDLDYETMLTRVIETLIQLGKRLMITHL